eukprot:g11942.t1
MADSKRCSCATPILALSIFSVIIASCAMGGAWQTSKLTVGNCITEQSRTLWYTICLTTSDACPHGESSTCSGGHNNNVEKYWKACQGALCLQLFFTVASALLSLYNWRESVSPSKQHYRMGQEMLLNEQPKSGSFREITKFICVTAGLSMVFGVAALAVWAHEVDYGKQKEQGGATLVYRYGWGFDCSAVAWICSLVILGLAMRG